jgi:hypothetical protein
VFTVAWERFKLNWVVLVFTFFVQWVLALVIQMLIRVPLTLAIVGTKGDPTVQSLIVSAIVFPISLLVTSFFYVGLIRIWLQVARGQTPDFATLFSGGDRLLAMFVVQLLGFLAICLGFAFFVVPGVILALGLGFAWFDVVDSKSSPIDAFGTSWNATKGHKGNLFVFMLAVIGINLAGFAALCVGIFATIPLTYLAMAVVYTRITGRGPLPLAAAAPAGYPGYPQQQPAYGQPAAMPPGYGPQGYGPPPGFGGPGGQGGPPPGYGGPQGGPPPGYGGPQGGGYGGGGGYGPPGGR